MEDRLSLFSLPQSILCTIFSKWLPVDSVCVLDTAVADLHMRRVLLENLFTSAEFEFENNMVDNLDRNSSRDGHGFVQWLYKRRIYIRQIRLNGWLNVRDEGLGMLSDTCMKVQCLDLCGCREVTDVGISRLSEGCQMLQELDLSWCRLVTDVGIIRLSEGCQMLQILDLSSCRLVTDVGIIRLSEG